MTNKELLDILLQYPESFPVRVDITRSYDYFGIQKEIVTHQLGPIEKSEDFGNVNPIILILE